MRSHQPHHIHCLQGLLNHCDRRHRQGRHHCVRRPELHRWRHLPRCPLQFCHQQWRQGCRAECSQPEGKQRWQAGSTANRVAGALPHVTPHASAWGTGQARQTAVRPLLRAAARLEGSGAATGAQPSKVPQYQKQPTCCCTTTPATQCPTTMTFSKKTGLEGPTKTVSGKATAPAAGAWALV